MWIRSLPVCKYKHKRAMYRKTYHSSRWMCGRLCKKLQKIKEENKAEVRLQGSKWCLFDLLIVRKLSSVSKQTDECCMHTMNDKVVASMKTSVTILVRSQTRTPNLDAVAHVVWDYTCPNELLMSTKVPLVYTRHARIQNCQWPLSGEAAILNMR